MNKGPSTKPLILFAVGVILIGGGFVYWQHSSKSSAQSRLAVLSERAREESEVKSELQYSRDLLTESQNKLQHLELNVPDVAYIPTLLTELENVGKAHNITIVGVRPVLDPTQLAKDEEETESGYQEIEIDITGRGSYRAILDLLNALEQFPKVVSVQTVTLTPRRQTESDVDNQLEAVVRLTAYVFPETKQVAPEAPVAASPHNASEGGAS